MWTRASSCCILWGLNTGFERKTTAVRQSFFCVRFGKKLAKKIQILEKLKLDLQKQEMGGIM